jgi:hypothetical protein
MTSFGSGRSPAILEMLMHRSHGLTPQSKRGLHVRRCRLRACAIGLQLEFGMPILKFYPPFLRASVLMS